MSYTASRPSGLPVSTAVASRQSALAWGEPSYLHVSRHGVQRRASGPSPPDSRSLRRWHPCCACSLARAARCGEMSGSIALSCHALPAVQISIDFFLIRYLDACSIHSDAVRRPIGGVSISIHCSPLPRHAAERGQLTLTRVCDDLPRQPRVRR